MAQSFRETGIAWSDDCCLGVGVTGGEGRVFFAVITLETVGEGRLVPGESLTVSRAISFVGILSTTGRGDDGIVDGR